MLSSILSKILISLLSAIGGWLVRHFQEWWKDRQTESDAEKSVDPLKKADPNDGKAIDDASDGALGGF